MIPNFISLLAMLAIQMPYPCDQGVKQFEKGDFQANADIPEWQGKGDRESRGVFCPPDTGNYYFKFEGRIQTEFKFRDYSRREGGGTCDTIVRGSTTGPYNMTYGKCELFRVFNYKECSLTSTPWHKLLWSRDNQNWKTMDTVARCEADTCLRGLSGANCDIFSDDVFCNGNGVRKLNDDTTAYCECTSFKESPFCEDPSVVPGYQLPTGLTWERYTSQEILNEATYIGSSEITNVDISDYHDSYVFSAIKGRILLPQPGEYQFRVVGAEATIKYEGTTTGSLNSFFSCMDEQNKVVQGQVFRTTSRRLTDLEITFNSGCSLGPTSVKLEWKFGRLYNGINNAPWTSVPDRYIFL